MPQSSILPSAGSLHDAVSEVDEESGCIPMLTSAYAHRRVPANLDKSLETGENRRIRLKSEDRDMLISILDS